MTARCTSFERGTVGLTHTRPPTIKNEPELIVEDISVYSMPTQGYSMEQAGGDFVVMLLWPETAFQSRVTEFRFDRQTGRIQLPFDG